MSISGSNRGPRRLVRAGKLCDPTATVAAATSAPVRDAFDLMRAARARSTNRTRSTKSSEFNEFDFFKLMDPPQPLRLYVPPLWLEY
jgi:hypothetical protein